MTRVDFYVLPEGATDSAVLTACKLCDKAVGAGHRVYVSTADGAVADDFDGALWSFRQGGFIAHERYTGAPVEPPLPPVLIGGREPPDDYREVLVNLGAEVPAWFSRFDRVLDIAAGDVAQREQARARYKFYRDRGYELKTHTL